MRYQATTVCCLVRVPPTFLFTRWFNFRWWPYHREGPFCYTYWCGFCFGKWFSRIFWFFLNDRTWRCEIQRERSKRNVTVNRFTPGATFQIVIYVSVFLTSISIDKRTLIIRRWKLSKAVQIHTSNVRFDKSKFSIRRQIIYLKIECVVVMKRHANQVLSIVAK